MSGVAGEQAIEFMTHLADQNAFEVLTGRRGEMQLIDLSEHVLNFHNGWFNRSIDAHETSPENK